MPRTRRRYPQPRRFDLEHSNAAAASTRSLTSPRQPCRLKHRSGEVEWRGSIYVGPADERPANFSRQKPRNRRRQGVLGISVSAKNCVWRMGLVPAGVVVLALELSFAPARTFAQDASQGTVSAEASPQIFATMCALYASGFPAESAGLGADAWVEQH